MNLEPRSDYIAAKPVLRGGPVSTDRGFVLHRPGGQWDHSHKVSDMIQVTTSRDVLAAIARGEGPDDAFIALGYAGWEAGQLEHEIKENSWMLDADRCPHGVRPALRRSLERCLALHGHRQGHAEP